MRKKTGQYFDCEHCGKSFYRNPYYLRKTPRPRFCRMACRQLAIEAGTYKPGPKIGHSRPELKNGTWFACAVCSSPFYRRKSYAERGINKTCGKTECKSAYFAGANNPFWGKDHSPEMKKELSKHRVSREGYRRKKAIGFKQTTEARRKISEAMRLRWQKHRDTMIASRLPLNKPRENQRYRRNFTRAQRRDWKDSSCAWCKSTKALELDHVISIAAGGINIRQNCQTLCRSCNVWKSVFIDRPFFLSQLAIRSGSLGCKQPG